MTQIKICPHDPVIARDGRPFGSGQSRRMRCMDWLYPSVVTGSLRTMLGKQASGTFDNATITALKAVQVKGPFLLHENTLYSPAPKDIVIDQNNNFFVKRPAPLEDEEGCDLPANLMPVMLQEPPDEDFKPQPGPAFWSIDNLTNWLCDPDGKSFSLPESFSPAHGFLETIEHETRTHIKISPLIGAVDPDEGQLFITDGLAIPKGCSLVINTKCDGNFKDILDKLHSMHPLGGERRLSQWQTFNHHNLFACPQKLVDVLNKNPKHIRMILATPAIFKNGWLPGWLSPNLEGFVPETSLKVRLKGACIERWKPISGWGLEAGKVGPKPIRRLVPAGSVYFLEVIEGKSSELCGRWLESVCDLKQNQSDGFGLALWGIWQ